MRLLLPPSETKHRPRRGRPLSLDDLALPALTGARRSVLEALVRVSSRRDACDVLHVSEGLADQVEANVHLATAPTCRAADLYTGVLFDALDLASLDTAARRRATSTVRVASALFGVVRLSDRLPAYRLSMGVDLPGVGPLAAHWRAALDDVLPGDLGRGAIVDLRSSTYAAAWRPTSAAAGRTVAVHVVREVAGRRSVVSHHAKHTRGLVARHLLASGARPRSPDDVADALTGAFSVELEPERAGAVRRLTVVEPG